MDINDDYNQLNGGGITGNMVDLTHELVGMFNHDPERDKPISRHSCKLAITVFGATKPDIANALRDVAGRIDSGDLGDVGISAGYRYSYTFAYTEPGDAIPGEVGAIKHPLDRP